MKDVAFIDLEKAYNKIDRKAMWQILHIYGIGGELLTAVKSFYKESKACVREDKEEGWSKTGVCHVTLVVQHLHGWSGEGGES